jgi:hypothetical protein
MSNETPITNLLSFKRVGTDSNVIEEADHTGDGLSTDSSLDMNNAVDSNLEINQMEGNFGSDDVCKWQSLLRSEYLLKFVFPQ